MLRSPSKRGRQGWEVVSGAMEHAETPEMAALREAAEEAGLSVRLRMLGAFHAGSFRYDDSVTHMIDISFVAAYEGGEVLPGDDMAGSEYRWVSADGIKALAANDELLIPDEVSLFERALQCLDQLIQ